MKRKIVSFLIVLALCLNLCPTWAFAAESDTYGTNDVYFEDDMSCKDTELVSGTSTYDLATFSHTKTAGDDSPALRVTGTGNLTITGTESGKIISESGAGVEVEAGGTLSVVGPVSITGKTYALEIARGADAHISAGRYASTTNGHPAIHVADDDYAAILADGFAFFDESGNAILPENLASATTLTVKQCTAHENRTYKADSGTPTHTWTCASCGTSESEECTFAFAQDGPGTSTCQYCSRGIKIVVDESALSNLVYDGTTKPQDVPVTVTLSDGPSLVRDTDFTVNIEKLTNAGQAKVTVNGKTFNGTFIKTYTVEKAEPKIEWQNTTCAVDYDGKEVDNLPDVNITAVGNDDLSSDVRYAYTQNGSDFTEGLPTDAGSYRVKAYLEASDNYLAMETNPLLELTINKIDPIKTAPEATTLTFNRDPQDLVTAGTLDPVAAADGLKILFSTSKADGYSETIPTGTNAGEYHVWYKVDVPEGVAGNYNAFIPTEVTGVKIARKSITPTVTVEPDSYVYDGSKKQPKVTVKDGTFVLDEGQYTVTWAGAKGQTELRLADTYTATITGKDETNNGNYDFDVTAKVEIVPAKQNALVITGKPTDVYYGDVIKSLGTTGGTADGKVTWSITEGKTNSTINETAGVLEVKDIGTITVKAERTVPNYGTVSDTWTFTVQPKAVTAEVTVEPKVYDKDTTATVSAVVKDSDLVNASDRVTITGLEGDYDTPNVGTGKIVTLNATDATKDSGDGKYVISYPATVTGNITPKPVTVTVTLSGDGLQTDNATPPTYSYTYDGTAKTPTVTVTADDDGTVLVADRDYTVSYSNNINKGNATVTVTAKAGGNYTFNEVETHFTIGQKQAQVLTAPEPAGDPLTFNNRPQKLVTSGTASGGKMVYSKDNKTFTDEIPTETNAGTYKVYYKVAADDNHIDSDVDSVEVIIIPKTVKDPTIELRVNAEDPDLLKSYTYDGTAKEPKVVVKDGNDIISTSEYNVGYSDNVSAGHGTVNITSKTGGNYIVTGSATFVINKADIKFDPVPSAAAITYNGKPQQLLTPGTFSGGTVQYALDSATSTYTDAIPTAIEAGTYNVYYKVIGDENHNNLPVQGPVPVTIQRKELTNVTIELSPARFKYDGEVHRPTTVTVKDGETVLPTSEYSWKCDEDSPTAAGSHTITITDAAGGNYDLSKLTTNTATFTIGRAEQEELVIEGKPEHVYYGDSFQLTAKGGSGTGGLTWSSTGPATMTTDGTLTITGVGTVNVTVVKAGDTNYEQTSAHWTFTAEPKQVTASVTVDNKAYDGNTTATVAAASIATLTGDTVTIEPTSIKASFDTPNVGENKSVMLDTSNVQVTGDDVAKYAISWPDDVKANITQATTTKVTKAPAAIDPLTYNGQPQALVTAGETNVGFLVYSLDGTNFSAEVPTGTNADTYTVYYKVDETNNYTGVDVNATAISVTIDPKNITSTVKVEPSTSSFPYDGAKHEPTFTVKDGDTVLIKDQDYTVTWEGPTGQKPEDLLKAVGTYTATIKNVDGGNYTFNVPATVDITPAGQNAIHIIGQPENVYYGDVITSLKTDGGSGEGTVKWSITSTNDNAEIEATTGKLTITGIGSVTVRAEREVANHVTVGESWTFTVEPKPVEAEVTIVAKEYDGKTDIADRDITAEVKTSDLVGSDTPITITGLKGVYEDANAGTGKTVTLNSANAKVDGDAKAKYTISYPATARGDISRKTVTVKVELSGYDLQGNVTDGYYYNYDGIEKTPTVTVKADGSATLTTGDYTVSYTNNRDVSTETEKATVTVKAKAGGNYEFDDATANFEIRKTSVTLTTEPVAKDLTYTGAAQALVTAGVASGGTVQYSLSEDGTYDTAIPTGIDAGSYTVYYKVVGDGNHADIEPCSVTAIIKPKPITAAITLSGTGLTGTSGSYSYAYDGTAKTPDVTVKDGNVEITNAGGKTEYTVSYQNNTDVGTATVTVSNANGSNYSFSSTVNFQITKAAPNVTTSPVVKGGLTYTGEPLDLLATMGKATGGTVVYSLDGVNYNSTMPTATAVGDHTIHWKVQGDANHSDTTEATLTVTIGKNTVNNPGITLSHEQFKYNGSQQKPTVTVTDDSGRVIPASEYTTTFAAKDPANNTSNMVDVGTYSVTIAATTNSNYEFTGTLTKEFKIVPADQETISITGTKLPVTYGEEIQLGISGGTGNGTLTWEVTVGTSTISNTGLLTVKDAEKSITVTVTRTRSNFDPVTATWTFTPTKKPVTAEVTVAAKNWDGKTDVPPEKITVNVPTINSDVVTITGLTGQFDTSDVGTGKTVTLTNGTVGGADAGKYDVTIPGTTTASILAIQATCTAPGTKTGLTYNAAQSQELVTAGNATGGTMVYSLDGKNFSPDIPKGKDAGTYTVHYKVQGDQNHTDSDPQTVTATINKQTIEAAALQITLSPSSVKYDGEAHYPEITLQDGTSNVIPASEYMVNFVTDGGKNWTDVDTYTVKIENADGGNYDINTATKDFAITITEQDTFAIINRPGLVTYGDSFTLSTSGGSGTGVVTWTSSADGIAHVDGNGLVEIKGVGNATITAKKAGDGNHNEVTATYDLNAHKKLATVTFTADDREYKENDVSAVIHPSWTGLVGKDTIGDGTLSGAFADANVGTNKTVNITGDPVSDTTSQKYDITINRTTTASITKARADAPNVTAVDNLKYTGSAQTLVTGGDANTLYCTTQSGVYSTVIPTGTNAGTYTVWYKAPGDDNHTESTPKCLPVTISPKELTVDATKVELTGDGLQKDGSGYYYQYDGKVKTPSVIIVDGSQPIPTSEYSVTYANNQQASTDDKPATVTIKDKEGGNYTFDGTVTVEFTIKASAAILTGAPQDRNLTYNGEPQELVTVGTATGGHIEYKLSTESTYSTKIPEGTNAGTYTVEYKVVGENGYQNSDTGSITVTIQPKTVVSPTITVNGGPFIYKGSAYEPTVTIVDDSKSIDVGEYTLTYQNNVNAGTATVIVSDNNGGNYTVNGSATFEIGKAAIDVGSVTAPTGKSDLKYNGTNQELLATAGSATGGTMVYALSENGSYSPAIPTGKAVDSYTVWYKVQGDDNHKDTEAKSVNASIIVNTVENPTIQVMPDQVKYTGEKQEPTVTVWDGTQLIDSSEYTVTYLDEHSNNDLIQVGTYTVTVTGDNTHYSFTKTATYTILPADQTLLTITGTREHVYYGDSFYLATTGGVSGGAVTWAVDNDSVADINTKTGELTVKGVGSVKVTATCSKSGYTDQTATWTLVAEKKPVTAVVTAAPKTYNGNADATVTANLQPDDYVGSDSFTITLTGCTFEDANAGTNKQVNVKSNDLTFTVNAGGNNCYENYAITYPATVTASITKAEITSVTAPDAETDADKLTYTGQPVALLKTAGSATGGTMEYSTDGQTYSASLPTGTDAKAYDVWYRVKGDGNHNDKAGVNLGTQVTIDPQEVTTPTIEFTPNQASYNGTAQKPSVTVKDAGGRVIPESEYTVGYGISDWTAVSTDTVKHIVTVTDNKTDGNYNITETTADFTILPAGQDPLSIVNQPGTVRYGTDFTLSTSGGSGAGTVTWQSSDTSVATIDQNGLVKVQKAGGPVTITATRTAAGHTSATATWTFSVEKKPVTAIVTAKDKPYDGNDTATLDIKWNPGDLVGSDTLDLSSVLEGKFDNANAGEKKTVTIMVKSGSSLPDGGGKYDVRFNETTTASITREAATVSGGTTQTLTYDGTEQNLVTGVTATNGRLVYSEDGTTFVDSVPTGRDADRYQVWYKALGSTNYADSEVHSVYVTIQPKTVTNPNIELDSESVTYDGHPKEPAVVWVKDGDKVIPSSEYTISYSNNTSVGTTARVNITDVSGGNYTVNGSKTFTITAGVVSIATPPQAKDLTYNGFDQALVTAGTAVNGSVVYSTTQTGTYSGTIPTGNNAGFYQVWYKAQGDGGETTPESVIVEIKPRQTVAVVSLDSTSFPYTGNEVRPNTVTVTVNGVTLAPSMYQATYSNNKEPGTATVTVTSIGGNYQFTASATFTIAKAKAAFLIPPEGKTGLVYTGQPQELVSRGYSAEGIVLYSTNAATYSAELPTGTNVRDDYMVFVKVQGDATHADSDLKIIGPIAIAKNDKGATVTLESTNFPWTGSALRPPVTVLDSEGNVINSGEYTVNYSNNTNVGEATVTATSKSGGNYSFTANTTFQIVPAGQTPLTINGKPEGTIYYGDTFSLTATGGSGSGAVTWESSDTNVATITDGVVKINKSGSAVITAKKGSDTATWTLMAKAKPVTATVYAADKVYDGTNTATVTVALNGLLPGDIIATNTVDGVKATGQFTDVNVGTRTVLITLTVPTAVSEKYDITCDSTATANITPKPAEVQEANKPALAGSLTYNGGEQALLTSGGTADGGNLMYSLDGREYSYTIPTGTDAKTYTVWYKVEATSKNYEDSAPVQLGTVTISADPNTPTVKCNPDTLPYNGTKQTPTVEVWASNGKLIPESEYTVEFPKAIITNTYEVTVTDKPGGNYNFTNPVTGTFQIVAASQNHLTIDKTNVPAIVHYGDTFRLSVTGQSGDGAIVWSVKGNSGIADITQSGGDQCLVTVKDTGTFTIEAYQEATKNYAQSNTASVSIMAEPKSVTPVVIAKDKTYDGKTDATFDNPYLRDGALVGTDNITLSVGGVFTSPDVGTNKQVSLTTRKVEGPDAAKYTVNWPDSVTATITKADAKIVGVPTAATGLKEDGTDHQLLTSAGTTNGIGTIVYCLNNQNGTYTSDIPKGTTAGTYQVWYKIAESANYTVEAPAYVTVVITEAVSNNGTDNTDSTDTSDTNTVPSDPDTGTSGTSDTSGTSGTNSISSDAASTYSTVRATVSNGTANSALNTAAGNRLVSEAVKNQSNSIVLKPEITGSVNKAKVSIPAATASQINSETSAALTVSAPIADVTIPNMALDTLGSAGGTVDVVTEQVGDAVTLTLSAGGETVERVPGGVTLTVPAEDATPGTVAVLVGEDGSRQVIQKSVAKDGTLSVPLNGSATVEIVDNSKDFTDVQSTDWESDAVDFVSSRELFGGTSDTTFSPDQEMSRAMLAKVLYNLEGQPDQTAAVTFDDVSSEDWYAESVAWAAEKGIVGGYGNGEFGPKDSITREQFAVMLWRYAGSPAADGDQALAFTDADQASSYAEQALRWAVANDIMNGYDGKLDPGGTATRAQAAQMLKNFMENT